MHLGLTSPTTSPASQSETELRAGGGPSATHRDKDSGPRGQSGFALGSLRKRDPGMLLLKRSNQSIQKEIRPGYSLEGLMLKLKLQYFGHLMRRTDSLEKTLLLGKIEGRRRRG